MTVSVAFVWELEWNSPIKEADLWVYPLRDFAIDEIYATPITGLRTKYIKECESLRKIIDLNRDKQVVWCHQTAEELLTEFAHPKDALYIFEQSSFNLINPKVCQFHQLRRENDLSVCIETPKNSGLIWGSQAASIILHDRFIRNPRS